VIDPSEDDLLGYVLGALDADQHEKLQRKIDRQPQYDELLLSVKFQLAPLELIHESESYRPGLARRTCEAVAGFCKDYRSNYHASDVTAAGPVSSTCELSANGSWSVTNVLAAALSIGALAVVLFPLLASVRQQSAVIACGNNLRSLGVGLASYAEEHAGKFVEIPVSGPLSFAGILGPILKDSGLIENDNWFACAGVKRDLPIKIPSVQDVHLSRSSEDLDRFRRTASGDYGYSFGHVDQDRYFSPCSLGRPYQILLADRPAICRVDGPSDNHGGRGQNCLFEDFHVEFVAGNSRAEDLVYVNAYNVVGPGIGPRDSVIGPSHLSPLRSPQLYKVDISD
jgi:hypothetical protein